MQEINNLLEKRRESLRRDHENGFFDRNEYIAVKAELMAIQLSVDELAARQKREREELLVAPYPQPVEGEQC